MEHIARSCAAVLPLSVADALDVFHDAGMAKRADARLFERLAAVQELLGSDLQWVEATLASCAETGKAPATEAAQHLIGLGGKRVRPQAVLLSAACFGPITQSARSLALAVELVHSSSLLHDDVADEGMERRGAPTARRLFGNAMSVLAGDLLLVHALEETAAKVPAAMPSLLATLRQLVDGEVIQLRGRTDLDVRESTYQSILRGKTASLFAWATASGAMVGGASEVEVGNMRRFGELMGVAFQLVDDVLDYTGADTGKTSLCDLREGKLTLPLVVAAARRPEILELLTQIHAGDESHVDAVAEAVISSGACDEVRRRALDTTERAIENLSTIPNCLARRLLESVTRELAGRLR